MSKKLPKQDPDAPKVSIELIMCDKDYNAVKTQYENAEMEQKKCSYKVRRCLSQNIVGQFFCCCLKVNDQLNIPWNERTPQQKKYRAKQLWRRARLVYHFIKIKFSAMALNSAFNKDDNNDDGDVDLENINNSQEHVWKWYIIRQENTLPQIWNFLTNSLTIYALFTTPFVLVFSQFS